MAFQQTFLVAQLIDLIEKTGDVGIVLVFCQRVLVKIVIGTELSDQHGAALIADAVSEGVVQQQVHVSVILFHHLVAQHVYTVAKGVHLCT